MPLVQGESLRDRLLREKLLTVDEFIRLIKQVASALDFAHRQGVIHRDIKPENILLHDGEVIWAPAVARGDSTVWSGNFERNSSDVLSLQAELALAVARPIKVALTPVEQTRLTSVKTVDPESHDAYLKGRYFFNRPSDDDLQKAIEQFEIAVQQDSTFALAYSGLSDAYLWAGYNEGFITATGARSKARILHRPLRRIHRCWHGWDTMPFLTRCAMSRDLLRCLND